MAHQNQMLKSSLQQSEARERQLGETYQSELLMAEMSDDVMTGAHAWTHEVAALEARESELHVEVSQAKQYIQQSNESMRRSAEAESRMEQSFQVAYQQAMADKDEMALQCRVVSAKAGETYKDELSSIQTRADRMLNELKVFSDASRRSEVVASQLRQEIHFAYQGQESASEAAAQAAANVRQVEQVANARVSHFEEECKRRLTDVGVAGQVGAVDFARQVRGASLL